MNTVRIGPVELGPGRPRLCVPLTASTVEALEAEARAIPASVADLAELRIDRFADLAHGPAVERAIAAVRSALDPSVPILVTCRSIREGGGADLPPAELERLVSLITELPGVAAIDVEMEAPEGSAATAVGIAHDRGIPVVMSFHDLTGTPSHDDIVGRLLRQQDLGADVVKLACTPRDEADVLTLLAATRAYADRHDARPAITMAMGPLGVVSRIAGETFGSALTFGTVGAASAPGQLDATALRAVLDLIHDAQGS